MPAMVRLNVGMLGLSHDHVWGNLAALRAGDQGRLVAAAEPDRELRERLRALDGGVAVHDSFDALLERRDLDALFVFSDNRTSAELAARALGRGLPVMLEKPMAADLPGAGGRRAGRQRFADDQLAPRVAPGTAPWPHARARRRHRRADPAQPSRRPRGAPRVRLLAAVLRLAL